MIIAHILDENIAGGLQPRWCIQGSRRNTDGIRSVALPEQATSAAFAEPPARLVRCGIPVEGGIFQQLEAVEAAGSRGEVVAGSFSALGTETVDYITQFALCPVANALA